MKLHDIVIYLVYSLSVCVLPGHSYGHKHGFALIHMHFLVLHTDSLIFSSPQAVR